ncbi:hypothetical protein [Nocardia sp. NPDC058633]|uniref:hypothetical protein n=1 Tax=Nocardia sp. NPDC058633 TaxID=3346568 RepID=UPI003649B8CB
MRNTLTIAVATIATTALIGTAHEATAQPGVAPSPTAVAADSETGSAAVDSASAAAPSAGYFIEHGDIIGIIVLLGVTPIHMLTGGICDLATFSALPDPCSPTRYVMAGLTAN